MPRRRNRVRIELNPVAARELLRSPEVVDELLRIGDQVAAAAGPGYEVEEWVGVNRARVQVRTEYDNWASRAREMRDHNLIRALGGSEANTPDPNELIEYVSRAGVRSMRTRREVANYTRNRRG